MNLSAIALNCTLKRDAGPPSSTDRMIGVIGQEFAKRHVRLSETIRVSITTFSLESGRTRGKATPGLCYANESSQRIS